MSYNVIVKPTHLCNLSCDYCYNDDVRRPVMSLDLMERMVEQAFDYVRGVGQDALTFIWHGGEPAIAGLAFYRAVVDVQRRVAAGLPYENLFQTNGTLLDDEWCAFLRDESFLASISIDGPADVHDAVRTDKGGHGSYDRVAEAIERVRAAGVPLGVCVTVSRANIDRLPEVYDFLVAHELPFNLIPLNRSGGAREHFDDLGIGAEEYAPAYIAMYDKWFDADPGYVYCQDFVLKTRAIMAGRSTDCISAAQCGTTNVSVDPVGDVYGCASLSGHDETRLGSLTTQTLAEIMAAPRGAQWQRREVDPQCARCRWQHVCNGGCQARAWKYFGTTNERDYYCPSLFAIYEHIAGRLAGHFDTTFTATPAPVQPSRPFVDPAVPVTLRRFQDGPALV